MLPSQSGNLNGKSSEKFVAKRTLGSILRLGCHPSGAAFAVLADNGRTAHAVATSSLIPQPISHALLPSRHVRFDDID